MVVGEFGGRKFLGFERLTHIPIAKKLLSRSLLTRQEEKWIDDYHEDVWTRVSEPPIPFFAFKSSSCQCSAMMNSMMMMMMIV